MPSYSPSPTNPIRYTRPLGENETYIKLIGDSTHSLGRSYWSINSWATLHPTGKLSNPSVLQQQLRKAWAHLRFQQPSIAAYVAENDEDLVYDIPGAEKLEKWMTESFMIDEEAERVGEVMRRARLPKYWTLTFLPRSNEVLCHTAHWRSDGIGAIQLFDALFALLATPDLCDPKTLAWGEEVERLAPSIETIANIPKFEDIGPDQRRVGKNYLRTFELMRDAVGIPYLGSSKTLPTETVSQNLSFSARETQEIVKKCKDRDISVTAALHASIAATKWSSCSQEREKQHYTSTARFSFKPYVPAPYNSSAYAACLLTTGWLTIVQPTESWEEHARLYTSVYRNGLSKDFLDAYRVYAGGLCEVMRNPPIAGEGATPPSEVDVSSIGKLSQYVQVSYGSPDYGVSVLDIGVGTELLSRQAVIYIWTFREQLTLSITYNSAFHNAEQMKDFVEGVKKDILENLDAWTRPA
jgi:hypothetical protein